MQLMTTALVALAITVTIALRLIQRIHGRFTQIYSIVPLIGILVAQHHYQRQCIYPISRGDVSVAVINKRRRDDSGR